MKYTATPVMDRAGTPSGTYNVYVKQDGTPPRVVKRGVRATSREHAIAQVK